ncbi:MAG: acetyl-CoA C-acyltransferase, partial [Gammaproteobacteria bacterium]
MSAAANNNRVAVVGGARTPFVKSGSTFKNHTALDLGVHAIDGLLAKQNLDPELVDELMFGIVVADSRIPQFAREVNFASRLPARTRALTLADNCITGISAMAVVHQSISSGRAEIGIAGGVESMSNPTLAFSRRAARKFLDAAAAKTFGDKVKLLGRLRPSDFKPHAPGIAEPSTGLSMGEHTELMVKEWEIPREEQDEVAYRSHMNAHAASTDGRLPAEIHPLDGIGADLLVRADTSMDKLAKLSPVFDRTNTGSITAGNSSPLTDGAAAILLMSEARATKEGCEPLAFIRDFEFAAIDPKDGLLMGPAIAVPRLLRRTNTDLAAFDVVEMHEAFAGQLLCNLKAWKQGWKEPAIGEVDKDKLNPLGSSIAVGHPFAATGARIATTLANEMQRRDAKSGLISVCGAGATAAAMILERD